MLIRLSRHRFAAAFAIAAVLGAAAPARAQYFGRNKVQYKNLQFEVLKTEHFQIYFYPEEQAAVDDLARMAERWYARLSKIFNYDLSSIQPIVVYASRPTFARPTSFRARSVKVRAASRKVRSGAIVLPLAGTLMETDHVLGHELVHAFQYDMARLRTERRPGGGGARAIAACGLSREWPNTCRSGPSIRIPRCGFGTRPADDGKLPAIGDLNDPAIPVPLGAGAMGVCRRPLG